MIQPKDEQRYDGHLILRDRQLQRRQAGLVLGICIRSIGQQQPQAVLLVPHRRSVQRAQTFLVRRIGIGAKRNQQLCGRLSLW